LLGLIRSIRQRTNPQLRYRLLLTMLNRENEIQQTLREQIRGAFKTAVFDTLIEIDPHVSESPLHSLPITAFAPNSQGAEQYRQLAQELTAYARNIAKGSTQAN
jgi:chromosome partitioning protein